MKGEPRFFAARLGPDAVCLRRFCFLSSSQEGSSSEEESSSSRAAGGASSIDVLDDVMLAVSGFGKTEGEGKAIGSPRQTCW